MIGQVIAWAKTPPVRTSRKQDRVVVIRLQKHCRVQERGTMIPRMILWPFATNPGQRCFEVSLFQKVSWLSQRAQWMGPPWRTKGWCKYPVGLKRHRTESKQVPSSHKIKQNLFFLGFRVAWTPSPLSPFQFPPLRMGIFHLHLSLEWTLQLITYVVPQVQSWRGFLHQYESVFWVSSISDFQNYMKLRKLDFRLSASWYWKNLRLRGIGMESMYVF
jgi:hypothetical protein